MKKWKKQGICKRSVCALMGTILGMLAGKEAWADADGNAGINEATNEVKGYFNTGVNLMYAIGRRAGAGGSDQDLYEVEQGGP